MAFVGGTRLTGRPQTKKATTPNGKRLLDLALELDGTISGFARRAGVSEQTVRRYIFNRPTKSDWKVIDKLEKAGWPRPLLVSS